MVQQATAAGLLTVPVDECVIANFFLTNFPPWRHGFFVNPEHFGPERFALHGVSARREGTGLSGQSFYVSRAASFALTIRCFIQVAEICNS